MDASLRDLQVSAQRLLDKERAEDSREQSTSAAAAEGQVLLSDGRLVTQQEADILTKLGGRAASHSQQSDEEFADSDESRDGGDFQSAAAASSRRVKRLTKKVLSTPSVPTIKKPVVSGPRFFGKSTALAAAAGDALLQGRRVSGYVQNKGPLATQGLSAAPPGNTAVAAPATSAASAAIPVSAAQEQSASGTAAKGGPPQALSLGGLSSQSCK